MVGTWRQLDALARTIYLESVSFDELQQFSKNKEQLGGRPGHLAHRPLGAVQQPHRRLQRAACTPVLGYIRPHTGIDFGCDRGTPVYATGDAVVEIASANGFNGGYGKQVLLNHEFGYKTRYAHLNEVLVKPASASRAARSSPGRATRAFDGSPPPLRGDPQGRARQPDQLFQPQHAPRGVRTPDGEHARDQLRKSSDMAGKRI